VYLWSRRYVRDHDRALDVAQEVLVSAYKGLESYQGRSRFSSWLFAITRNKCLNAVAARSWKFDPEADLEALPSPDGAPEQALESEQERERLRAVLARHLDAEERNALWMLVEERMSIEQITHVLRLGNATGARGLLQRARRKLRAALDPQDLRMPS
jgi:RNA polymerase sigma-70 factor (ECF subfamily)